MSMFGNLFGGSNSNNSSNNNQQQQSNSTQPQQGTKPDASNLSPGDQAIKDGKMPGTDQLPVNPLDAYKKLWDNSNTPPEAPPAFSLDPKTLGEVSSKLNFTQSMDPELLAKATSGDTQAMMQMMNHVGQQAYQAALSHSSALTDKFVGARSEFDQKGFSSKVKSELTSSHFSDIPNSNNPVVRAELSRIATAMQKENPDASPQEIAGAAKDYFKNIYAAMSPEPTAQEKQKTSGETNWDDFFNS